MKNNNINKNNINENKNNINENNNNINENNEHVITPIAHAKPNQEWVQNAPSKKDLFEQYNDVEIVKDMESMQIKPSGEHFENDT